jgi:hypothetical protein
MTTIGLINGMSWKAMLVERRNRLAAERSVDPARLWLQA